MRVLIACEESQAVCKAFRARGHEAYSCDIQPCSGGHPEWHIQGDVLQVLHDGWDLMIGHPPCTYLTTCANRAHARDRHSLFPVRDSLRQESLTFFLALFSAPIEQICLENPRGVISTMFRKPDQTIHPYFFGDTHVKATCLWLKNLPPLTYDTIEKPEPVYVNKRGRKMYFAHSVKGGSDAERAKERSKTFPGIARAMADQWGNLKSLAA